MTVLEADDLFRFYHPGDAEVRALRGASLTLSRGETVALVGPSGSGKSTLLACLAGLDEPDGGMVRIGQAQMTRRPEMERARLRASSIGFLAQANNLFDHLSVAENIRLQAELRGADGDVVPGLLDRVGLGQRGDAMPSMLSGGESARAGLAAALAGDPPILLADEPTAEVDAQTEALILDVLEARRAKGGAAIIATHSPALAARASRLLAIADGRIAGAEASGVDGGEPKAAARRGEGGGRPRTAAPCLIEALGVAKRYMIGSQAIDAVRPTSVRVGARDRIAIVGASGSGKSTLLNLLAGLERPSSGAVSWPGLDAAIRLLPAQIGFVFQSPSLLPALSAIENVALALDVAGADRRSSMRPLEALARLGIAELADKMPDQLSGGQMQRVALARALATRPRVIFADEPTGQLDGKTAAEVMAALLGAIADGETALVVATHDMAVASLMDERWRMAAGALIKDVASGIAA